MSSIKFRKNQPDHIIGTQPSDIISWHTPAWLQGLFLSDGHVERFNHCRLRHRMVEQLAQLLPILHIPLDHFADTNLRKRETRLNLVSNPLIERPRQRVEMFLTDGETFRYIGQRWA